MTLVANRTGTQAQDNETTMKSLLFDVKRGLMEHNEELSQIKTWKSGLFSRKKLYYPALTVLPVAETYPVEKTGGQYNVQRDIAIEVWNRDVNREKAELEVRTIMGDIVEIVRDRHIYLARAEDGRDTVFNFTLGRIQFFEKDEEIGTNIARARLPIGMISREWRPFDYKDGDTSSMHEPDPGEILALMFNVFKSESRNGRLQRNGIKENHIYIGTDVPFGGLGVYLSMNEIEETRNNTWAGADSNDLGFDIHVWSPGLPEHKYLNMNLKTVESVKDILQERHKWNGRAMSSDILRIDFGIDFTKERTFYDSRFSYVVRTQELLVEY